MIGRPAITWEDASFAVFTAIAWLSISFVSCPQINAKFVSKVGVEMIAAVPSLGPIMVLIEDDDRDFQEDDCEPCALPGMRLVWPSYRTLSQVTPQQSVSLSALAPAQHPLRC